LVVGENYGLLIEKWCFGWFLVRKIIIFWICNVILLQDMYNIKKVNTFNRSQMKTAYNLSRREK